MLKHHGDVIKKFESPYSWIYTLKVEYGGFLIAKAPKINSGFTEEQVRGRILKMLTEINTIHRVCLHSFIHRFGKIELIFGVPFLISAKRHMNLRDVIEEGPLNIVDVLTISIQLARAIEYIQSKGLTCHQDLKAENIFIDSIHKKFVTNGDFLYSYQAYLADFDLVNTAVIFSQPYGSRPYQAAEQYIKNGSSKFDKIDVFALGVNIIEMLTGGIHPIGVRTTDAWPVSSIGNKWSREDPWKKWARKPMISTDIKLDFDSSLVKFVEVMLNPNYDERPSINEVKNQLLGLLKECDENAHLSLNMYIDQADSAEIVNEEAGWPYMDNLVTKVNKLFELDN
jgi:serine/threonine protein kinase